MSGVTGAAGGACSAKINAAFSQFGVSDTNLQPELKAILKVTVQTAQHTLSNLRQTFGGGQPAGVASNPGTFSPGGIDMSAWEGKFSEAAEIGASLDKMESEAMQLMKSPKKEDQIKGQQMMQAVTQIMEAIIKAIQARGDAAKHAIQGSESR
jgi:hypothetical protein